MAKVEKGSSTRSEKGGREARRRQGRLAGALRQNLLKRKAQQRARGAGQGRGTPPTDGEA